MKDVFESEGGKEEGHNVMGAREEASERWGGVYRKEGKWGERDKGESGLRERGGGFKVGSKIVCEREGGWEGEREGGGQEGELVLRR